MKGWTHPAVRRGTIWFTAQAVFLAGCAVALVALALQHPTIERMLWAAAFVVLAVLGGFVTKWQIKKLRHEYRYEQDEETARE